MATLRRIATLALLAFGLLVSVVPAMADHIGFAGNMDATLSRGQSHTFNMSIEFRTGGFSGEMRVTVTGSVGLELGDTTFSPPLFTCNRTPSINICVGNVSMGVGGSITLTQIIKVTEFAYLPFESWGLQMIGTGLSGVEPRSGIITVSDAAPKVVLVRSTSGMATSFPFADLAVTTFFTLENIGDADTTITLTPTASFFRIFIDQPPGQAVTFPLAKRTKITPAVIAVPQPIGIYVGEIKITGAGVDGEIVVPVVLRVADRPQAPTDVRPQVNRIDVPSLVGGNKIIDSATVTASVSLSNLGTGAARGALSSNVLWLIPAEQAFTLEPGETKDANFTIDLAKRPDAPSPSGSVTGSLTFSFLLPSSAKETQKIAPTQAPGTGSVSIAVVSTVTPGATVSTIPPLAQFESAMFIPGLGRVQGSVGLFISDLSIYSQVDEHGIKNRPLTNIDLYYSPLSGGQVKKASLSAVVPPSSALFGDVVGAMYGGDPPLGSMMLRAPGFLISSKVIGSSATVFNVSNCDGTFGTTVPVFSSGRSATTGQKIFLSGLRKDSSGHTNFYVQETRGSAARSTMEFFNATGAPIGSTTFDVPPFAAVSVSQAVLPEGAVSAIVSHAAGSAGGLQAYATPVDRASGDTWAVADWPRVFGYAGTAPVVIPVAGAAPGANNTYFRTDVSIMNVGTTPGSGTLRFYNRTGEPPIDRTVNVGASQTQTFTDVTTNLHGVTTPHVGYLTFTPTSGSFAVTSRNYSTPVGSNATFGTGVPTLALSFALSGDIKARRFGGIDDASISTVIARRPATFRSNFGLIETSGQPATVKVTIFYQYPAGKAAAIQSASQTLELAPRQFILTSNIARAILGAEARDQLGDLSNMYVEFELVGGAGQVIPFISSVDNGTGDSIFRVE